MDRSVRTRRLVALEVLAGASMVGLFEGITAASGGRLGLGVPGFAGVVGSSLLMALLVAVPVAVPAALVPAIRRQPAQRLVLAGVVPAGGAWLAVAFWPSLEAMGWGIGALLVGVVLVVLSVLAARSPLGERAVLAAVFVGLWLPTLVVRDSGPTARASGMDRPNVLLVTVAGLRADRVGPHPADTAAFDRVAHEGAWLALAVSPSPDPRTAAASVLSGVAEPVADAADLETLATALRHRGYATGAFVGDRALARGPVLADGFGVYDDDQGWPKGVLDTVGGRMLAAMGVVSPAQSRRASDVVDRAERFISGSAGAWFTWVHLHDPEPPFSPPTPWDERYYEGRDPRSPSLPALVPSTLHPTTRRAFEGVRDPAYLEARYDGEVAYADAQVARLLALLDDAHLAARTLVVVVGLDGMVLRERTPMFGRDGSLSPEVVDVPVAIRWPGRVPVGAKVLSPTSLLDIGTTIMAYADPDGAHALGGVSLRPTLEGEGAARSVALSTSAAGDAVGARVPGALLVVSKHAGVQAWAVPRDADDGEAWTPGRVATLVAAAAEALGMPAPTDAADVRELLQILQPAPPTPLEPRFEP